MERATRVSDGRDNGRATATPETEKPPRAPHEPPHGAGRPWYRRPLPLAIAGVALVVLIAAGVVYSIHASAYESTDDAFIEGDVIRISPRVAGHVSRVLVNDNQDVEKGQLLVETDDREYRAALQEAQARALAAEAEARRARADAERARALFARQLIARAALDQAVAADRTAAAQLEAARAEVARLQLDLQFTRIVAPEAGRVTRKSAGSGPASPWRSGWTRFGARSSTGTSTASSAARARASACCRPRTRRGTS
jgi:membrane fusion protein (multidrug efflux system)